VPTTASSAVQVSAVTHIQTTTAVNTGYRRGGSVASSRTAVESGASPITGGQQQQRIPSPFCIVTKSTRLLGPNVIPTSDPLTPHVPRRYRCLLWQFSMTTVVRFRLRSHKAKLIYRTTLTYAE